MTRHLYAFAALLFALAPLHAGAQPSSGERVWHVGFNLGELPMHGSFKPGIYIGYDLDERIQLGFVYQVADRIGRGASSFNAKAIGLDGLAASHESVGQRAYVQARVRLHPRAPYLSVGLVFNDRDTETIAFDDRTRQIGSGVYTGPVMVTQSRPSGWRPALGLGYEFGLAPGLTLNAEWAGWWLRGAPSPRVSVAGVPLTPNDRAALVDHIASEFRSSPFNTYHVFQLGLGYAF